MLPKLHKLKEINKIIEIKRKFKWSILIKGRPIVAGPVFHTSGIFQFLHKIMQPALSLISQIVKKTNSI